MKFSMADVFGRTFNIVGKAFVPLFLINLVCYVIPYMGLYVGLQQALGLNLSQPNIAQIDASVWPILGVAYVVQFLLIYFQTSALTEIAVLQGGGKSFNIGSVLGHAAVNTLPILGIMILCMIGWFVGLILLIIPGFIFGLIYCVVIPAYVAEKPGFFGAFSRSAFLTKGHRWGIFGMLLLAFIIYYIVIGAVSAPLMMANFTAAAKGGVPPMPDLTTIAIITIVGAFFYVVFTAFNTAIYLSLRASKEMVSVDSVAKVFE